MSGDNKSREDFIVNQGEDRPTAGEVTGKPGRSTGPRTPAGKRRSSQNALKHGFYSREKIKHRIRPNDRREYRKALSDLIEEKKPVGDSEHFQLELMAEARHDFKRIDRLATATQITGFGSYSEYGFDIRHDEKAIGWRCDLPALETLGRIEQYKKEVMNRYYRPGRELERLQELRKVQNFKSNVLKETN